MRLSYSQLSTFSRCPKQYEYAFDLKYKRAISAGESFGSSIHNTLKKWGELEMRREKKPSALQLDLFGESERKQEERTLSLETLLTLFRESFIAEGYENTEKMIAAFKLGEESLRHWYKWWKQEERTVLSCEASFAMHSTNAMIIRGRFDRVEKTKNGIKIIDFKTSAMRSDISLKEDLQLSIYAKAALEIWGKVEIELSLLIINEEECREQKTKRTPDDLTQMMSAVETTHQKIVKKEFTATPSREKCVHCPYRAICPSAM